MAQRIDNIYKLVTYPVLNRTLMFALGADRALVRYAKVLDAKAGTKMLDVGCGPANILAYLPTVDYTGMDLNEKHIAFARERYGDAGRFLVGNAVTDLPTQEHRFDIITVTALLHHLSDQECETTLLALRSLLKPDGRIVTLDPTWLPKQRSIARLMKRLDSGLNIRTPEQYRGLTGQLDLNVASQIFNDLLRIPYDHFCMILQAKDINSQ